MASRSAHVRADAREAFVPADDAREAFIPADTRETFGMFLHLPPTATGTYGWTGTAT